MIKKTKDELINFSSTPKLVNGYGEVFDYKDSALAEIASEKIHQKRLNLEREINKNRVQKKVEKYNYYKFKSSTKTSYKSKIDSAKFRYRSDKKMLKEIIKNCNHLIKFEDFLYEKKKIVLKELNQFRKSTISTLKSIQYSDDETKVIEQKTNDFKLKAIEKEDKYLEQISFIEKILDVHPSFSSEDVSSTKNISAIVAPIVSQADIKYQSYLLKEINLLIRAYRNQYFFVYNGRADETREKKAKLKEVYIEEKRQAKIEYNSDLENEKNRINEKFKSNCDEAKNLFKKQKEEIELKELNSQSKEIQKELAKRSKEQKKEIRKIKAEEKQIYKNKLKEYKSSENNKTSFVFWSDKKEAIQNSGKAFNLRLMFSPKLSSLNKWDYKKDIRDIKAEYLQKVGQRLDQLTYDGSFMLKNGQSLQDFAQKCYENDLRIVEETKGVQKLTSSFEKMSENDKKTFESEKQKLKEKFDKDLQDLKQKLSNKEITKEAYRISKLKLEIFYEEDIKYIKMNLDSTKDKYVSKDILVKYHRQNKLLKKELQQDKNKISKETPIEYRKNNSIWMSIIAFIFPGVDSLILKNWKKAIFFLIVSTLVWALFIPYVFGAYNIKGEGIIGLAKLSWPTGEVSDVYGTIYSDARYALVEGVIALILLVLSISYLSVSAYQCFKITRAMEKGIRYNTWVETKKILRTSGFPYAISIPGLIFILFIVIMPVIVSLLLAFTNIGTNHNPAGGQETSWVGFEQFKELFTNREFFRPFGNVLWWNIVWAISTTLLVLFLGTIMALAIENKNIKCKALWRTIFILPWAIPAFLSILFFKVIFGDSSTSLVNSWLVQAGMKPVAWQSDATMSRLILILIQGWLGHSYIVLLVSGNMKSIPSDVYEAARIDGAKAFKQFMKMTLPIVLIQIAPLLISQFTFNFNNFSIIWLFNDGGSKIDPTYVYNVGNNDILLSWIFKMTFGSQAINITSNQAIASALVIVMSVFVVGASGIGFARSKAFRKGEDI